MYACLHVFLHVRIDKNKNTFDYQLKDTGGNATITHVQTNIT